ncbi:hypothetical protein KOW79_010500 [Hemibagrus wyckioides]|uniref:Uncharacterized protein n=1 Tax=Hemibagrus wyckioides TaxID=337641 RepID=A0A9D3NR35_9TELE|nr:hypothetical protein KOW79_010500 [Hemibagrus wyckioides]
MTKENNKESDQINDMQDSGKSSVQTTGQEEIKQPDSNTEGQEELITEQGTSQLETEKENPQINDEDDEFLAQQLRLLTLQSACRRWHTSQYCAAPVGVVLLTPPPMPPPEESERPPKPLFADEEEEMMLRQELLKSLANKCAVRPEKTRQQNSMDPTAADTIRQLVSALQGVLPTLPPLLSPLPL